MAKIAGIYLITVQRGTKPPSFYIGQTVDFRERKLSHLRTLRAGRHNGQALTRAFAKYGEAAFSFSMLIICNQPMLTFYEQRILDSYVSEFGERRILNVMLKCVTAPVGVKRTPEQCAQLSAREKGRKKSKTQIEAMRIARTGMTHSDETKALISEIVKSRPLHPNSRLALETARNSTRLDGLRAALVGKPKIHTAETAAKISATLTGKKQSAATIEKRAASLRGRKQQPEDIAKRVASRRANAVAKKASIDGDNQRRRQAEVGSGQDRQEA